MNHMKKYKIIPLTLLFIALLSLILWIIWGNTALQKTTYTLTSSRIPSSFDVFRIAHISDLHNTDLGNGNESLLSMIKEAEPDMIAITGDMIDSRRTNLDIALQFAEEALKIAPCYYVPGNHESRISEYITFRDKLMELGVVVLENQCIELTYLDGAMHMIGISDPSFLHGASDSVSYVEKELSRLIPWWDAYTIVLSHRPELFDVYVKKNADLVLSGHTHGGQFRFPFIGGLVAPHQGILPKYDAGLFTEGQTNMIISRGIGNSSFPFRFNNRPELVIIELKRSSV